MKRIFVSIVGVFAFIGLAQAEVRLPERGLLYQKLYNVVADPRSLADRYFPVILEQSGKTFYPYDVGSLFAKATDHFVMVVSKDMSKHQKMHLIVLLDQDVPKMIRAIVPVGHEAQTAINVYKKAINEKWQALIESGEKK